jgi:hypothetical protein
LIVAESFAICQSKAIVTRSGAAGRPKWQRIGNQINAAFIFARADFVKANGMTVGAVPTQTAHR